jgi:hypothetical protein
VTAQYPDILINEHPRVAFENLSPYLLFRGDVGGNRERLVLPVSPDYVPEKRNSALWRGYIATFRLAADGTLSLISYGYPTPEGATLKQEIANGEINGDFWLELRPFCSGPKTRVPFCAGRIVEDRTQWEIEDQTLRGRVTHKHSDVGLIIDIVELGNCFMPRVLLPPELRDDLDALMGRAVGCEIHQFDTERNNIIVRPVRFSPAELGEK